MPRTQIDKTRTIAPAGEGYTAGAKVAGRYKILGRLGQGGMGIVYKAHDSRLKRTVALKFLPPELTLDEDARKRFVREAQAAAALDHPHICTVHEIHVKEGQTFIVMAYIAGQSLKDKLASGPLPINEVLDIAAQVAEGLNKAHSKGIIHRDIKPSNILLTEEGQAKITDFGLAKLSRERDLTRTGTIMGTVSYMSPEQAKGENVDQRTDIWSLGVLLYEMLGGKLPFKGQHDQATIYSIINEAPVRLTAVRHDIPKRIEQIIFRALAKDKTKRYQNMQEFTQHLKQGRSFRTVGDASQLRLGASEKRKKARQPGDSTQAYEHYLKARQEIAHFTEDGANRALKYLRDGLEKFGENAVLCAGMGLAHFHYANLGFKQREHFKKAEEYAHKASQSGSESAPGHLLLGLIQQNFRGNQALCIHHLKRALALDADDFDALYWLSLCYGFVGKSYAAVPLVERLSKIDPHHPLSFLVRARLFYYEGRYDLALKAILERKKVPTEATMYRFWHALILSYNRRLTEAEEVIDQIAAGSQQDIWAKLSIFLRATLNGETKKIASLFSQNLKLAAQRDCQIACLIAIFYSMLNDRKNALRWLEVAAGRGFINYPFLAACDPYLDNIRGDARFVKFIKRVKREWENFKA